MKTWSEEGNYAYILEEWKSWNFMHRPQTYMHEKEGSSMFNWRILLHPDDQLCMRGNPLMNAPSNLTSMYICYYSYIWNEVRFPVYCCSISKKKNIDVRLGSSTVDGGTVCLGKNRKRKRKYDAEQGTKWNISEKWAKPGKRDRSTSVFNPIRASLWVEKALLGAMYA